MESFVRRLKYYGIGFVIGLIFVVFFFQNRGCSWLPSNRVKNLILSRIIVISDESAKTLKLKGLDSDDVIEALNDGDLNFSESDKDKEAKIYIIEKNEVKFAFTLPYESFISEVFINVKNSNLRNTSKGLGTFIHFPEDENLIYPDSSNLVSCQQEKLDLKEPQEILHKIKSSGKLDFNKTNLSQRPKPEHYIVFRHEEVEIGARIIWYKNKLNITSFESSELVDCK